VTIARSPDPVDAVDAAVDVAVDAAVHVAMAVAPAPAGGVSPAQSRRPA
jgi:hypothetical protein